MKGSIEMNLKKVRDTYINKINMNDGAHLIDHVDDVYAQAVAMNDELNLNIPPMSIILMAYTHDLFAINRDDHHQLAHDFVMDECVFTKSMDEEEVKKIAMAVLQHRASFKGDYYSEYSELLASADRGAPGCVATMIHRSFTFATSKLGKLKTVAMTHAFEHMAEKYGHGGYAKYPVMYVKYWDCVLNRQQDLIGTLVTPTNLQAFNLSSLDKGAMIVALRKHIQGGVV